MPIISATPVTFFAKAMPQLGKQERIAARTAMTNRIVRALEDTVFDFVVDGVLREPAMEHTAIPAITMAVPASRTTPLAVNRVCGKNTSSGINAPRLAMRPMMMG